MSQVHDPEMASGHDFSKGVRGKYAQRYARSTIVFRSLTERANNLSPLSFKDRARLVLSDYFGVDLSPSLVIDVPKKFDLVSDDKQIVGDAMNLSLGSGIRRPSATFAAITEYVWLLERTRAPETFLVFGNDRRVSMLWLESKGHLLSDVKFYFLDDDNRLELLTGPHAPVQGKQLIGAEGR